MLHIVDDEDVIRDALEWLAQSRGLTARGYAGGQAFLDALGSQRDAGGAQSGECVLLDVRMPGMGGLNVQEELRQRDIRLPLIFVSGHADVPIVVRAFKAGAVDFIEKPYNEQLLLDSVQQALSRADNHQNQSAGQARVQALLESLTPREKDVLLPLVQGYTNREIAEQLGVSIKTIDLYRSRVMKRMQAEHLPELVGMAIAAGLVDPLHLR